MKMRSAAVAATVLVSVLAGQAHSQQNLATTPVVSGLSRPLFVTAPVGDTARLFVVEQRSSSTGRIRIVNLPANTLNATPYLSISPVSTGGEQGLLGLAFHPNFLQNGYFFVNYTEPAIPAVAGNEAVRSAGSTVIVRYRANAPFATSTTADPASALILMRIRQPDANHNGGWITFGPDGNLLISTGDGGNGNDTSGQFTISPPGYQAGGNAQSINTLLGKLLRIDVDGPDNIPGNADDDGFPADPVKNYTIPAGNPFVGIAGEDEILHRGLRNAWRGDIDVVGGHLWLADVGQGVREEINRVPLTATGLNFGWRCMEGTRCTGLSGCTCNATSLTMPILEYGHDAPPVGPTPVLGCSITGGEVYRGNAIPCFRGHYIFADYCSGDIYSFRMVGNTITELTDRRTQLDPPGTPSLSNIVSFGTDASGEMYVVDQAGGEVFKIVAGTATGPDCNNNSIIDSCDIAQGTSLDANANGIPDECEVGPCDYDFNQDENIDLLDAQQMAQVFVGLLTPGANWLDGDLNGDENADLTDAQILAAYVVTGDCGL